jgi:hypothetical protein
VTAVLDVFDVARARGLHQHRGSGTADTARLPLEGLSAFGGGLEDYGIRTSRYPITPLPIAVKFSAPDLRDSVPPHGKLSQSARHLSRTDEGEAVGGMSK